MTDSRIYNPLSNTFITKYGRVHKKLIREGIVDINGNALKNFNEIERKPSKRGIKKQKAVKSEKKTKNVRIKPVVNDTIEFDNGEEKQIETDTDSESEVEEEPVRKSKKTKVVVKKSKIKPGSGKKLKKVKEQQSDTEDDFVKQLLALAEDETEDDSEESE